MAQHVEPPRDGTASGPDAPPSGPDVTGPFQTLAPSVGGIVRYERQEREGRFFVRCTDQPSIRLYIERGLVVDEAARKKYPKQTVFLDGVFSGAPFLDNETRQYSLDHHAGCVRSFTLSTCEQAMVMLLQGLPLGEGHWTLYVNEPDLDAMLAAWILLNHQELSRDPELLRKVMPLVRLEGVIDAHGLDRLVLSGLPEAVLAPARGQLEALIAEERRLKAADQWSTTDFSRYGHGLLGRMDETLLPAGYLNDLREITEVALAPLGADRSAVLCRSRQGIYAVESHLKRRHDKQLAVIVLDQGDGIFTVRQTNAFLERNLQALYQALNSRDPAVTGQTTEPKHLWGGSDSIGGSPRGVGSQLNGEEVLRIVQSVLAEGGWWRRMFRRITSIGSP